MELEKIEPGIMAARAVAVAKRSFNVPRTPVSSLLVSCKESTKTRQIECNTDASH